MRPGDDGYINAPEGETMMNLEGHTDWVNCVIQLADGHLVSCCVDNTIKIWDTISGSCLMTLEGHTNSVLCVIQLTDGRLLSGSYDSKIKIWDTISGSCIMTLQGHTFAVSCITQLTDGRLASGSGDSTLRIWNILPLSQQKWIRRRLLLLLKETSMILSESPELSVVRQAQYPSLRLLDPARRRDLDLLLRCSLNIGNRSDTNEEACKITLILKVLSMPELVIRIAEYL